MRDVTLDVARDAVTVSIVIQDARGFTYHYEDFTTSAENAQRALETLAEGYAQPDQDPTGRDAARRPLGVRARAAHPRD